ncbi:unnamed protein product (macronuclear) [Paramecium tetraurelia]|uniref:DOMON domain-containing protein n=1 Tax=Paramecium tetraurelia TaxID=5888 RepID=A0DD44_PARTE|nr:uncharacterized protein GSPATT00015820001 [Paramecium tetraurelia]CAK80961.1 unnamed protein product [Paramecium tetraurelia]|eukprot:XP_001448358.1 hypothetical protein (macronuclear) [Paramecium tetraurelia strain d4-2]
MSQITNNILIISIILVYAQAQISLNISSENSVEKYFITSTENMVVIGFEGQQEVRDYIFCRINDCTCEDMVSKGPRSHPQLNSIQQTINVQCIDKNTITFERKENGCKPYVWNNKPQEEEQKPYQPQKRITQANTYTDSDMTASLTVGSTLSLKWKFNTDDTIEICVILNKKSWVGIGFGQGMNGVDMFAINIIDGAAELLDLYATSESQPPTDSSQDITLISSSVSDSEVKARIKRKLNTGDSKDAVLAKGSTYTWSYATSSSLVIEDHKSNVGQFSITLSESGSQQTSNANLISLIFGLLVLGLII